MIPEDFDDIFPINPDEIVIPIVGVLDFNDLVEAFDESMTDSIDALANSFDTDNDILESIQDIKDEACGGDSCTSTEIADYLNQL